MVAQQCKCPQCHGTVCLKTVQMAYLVLCVFYHNLINKLCPAPTTVRKGGGEATGIYARHAQISWLSYELEGESTVEKDGIIQNWGTS